MAKKKKKKKSLNNFRQREYLKVGIVMLPDLKTERKAALDLIKGGQYKEEKA